MCLFLTFGLGYVTLFNDNIRIVYHLVQLQYSNGILPGSTVIFDALLW